MFCSARVSSMLQQSFALLRLSLMPILCATLSVVPALQRHLKQRPKKDVESSKWRYSLMNW